MTVSGVHDHAGAAGCESRHWRQTTPVSEVTGVCPLRLDQLLKQIASGARMRASTPRLPDVSLLDAIGSWVGRLNATAHYGGFRADDPAQARRLWYGDALASYRAAEDRGRQDRFHAPHFQWLRQRGKLAVVRDRRGGRPWPQMLALIGALIHIGAGRKRTAPSHRVGFALLSRVASPWSASRSWAGCRAKWRCRGRALPTWR